MRGFPEWGARLFFDAQAPLESNFYARRREAWKSKSNMLMHRCAPPNVSQKKHASRRFESQHGIYISFLPVPADQFPHPRAPTRVKPRGTRPSFKRSAHRLPRCARREGYAEPTLWPIYRGNERLLRGNFTRVRSERFLRSRRPGAFPI